MLSSYSLKLKTPTKNRGGAHYVNKDLKRSNTIAVSSYKVIASRTRKSGSQKNSIERTSITSSLEIPEPDSTRLSLASTASKDERLHLQKLSENVVKEKEKPAEDQFLPKEPLPVNGKEVDSDLIHINCSGFLYVTTEETLSRFPNSLLGDPIQRQALYSQKLNAYYLDRHKSCFESILQLYQTGIECPPTSLDLDTYHSEKDFYGLKRSGDTVIEIKESLMEDSSSLCCAHNRKIEIHKLLVNPPRKACGYASFYHVTDIAMIALATILFVVESEEVLSDKFELTKPVGDMDEINFWLFALNAVTILWFTVDFILRMVTWPKFLNYWKDYMNLLDIISVLPFYIEIFQWAVPTINANDGNYGILRALKLIRVVRVFKFLRHTESVMAIVTVMAKARQELLILFVSLFLFIITFGAIMFYLENDPSKSQLPLDGSGPSSQFSSILMSCWWVLVSVTTVGFGDMYPVTIAGKFVGSLVICLGLICLALPMTVIISKFSTEFDREKS